MYVLGMDGGGTKTELIAIGEDGSEIFTAAGKGINPKTLPEDMLMSYLCDLLDAFLKSSSLNPLLCKGIAAGIAGVYTDKEILYLKGLVAQCLQRTGFPTIPVLVTNDAEIAMTAGLGSNRGVVAVAGTGSIVYGVFGKGLRFRAGGWGHILGDQGSGYDIGIRALRSVMLSYDGVLASTRLTDLVLEQASIQSPEELRDIIYQPGVQKKDIAAFAKACIEAARQNDTLALEVITVAAEDMAVLTDVIIKKSEDSLKASVAVTGSMFMHSEDYMQAYLKKIHKLSPGVQIVTVMRKAAYGAGLLALSGMDSPIK